MNRRKQLALIHIAKQQLGISDEDWRALLQAHFGVRSSAELDAAGRMRLIEALKAMGFRPRRRHRVRASEDRAPLLAKIDALLIACGHLPRSYADGIARRMFGIERVEWCRPDELRKIVAALEYHKRRVRKCGKS